MREMKDQYFDVYTQKYISLCGGIRDGCLYMDSEVWGPGWDSEKHYLFSREATEKLFSVCSLEEFIELCREGHVSGMEAFLERNGIAYGSVTI